MSFLALDCNYGAWKLPSGKWMCATWNIKENHHNFLTEPNKCTEMGFDRLFEPDTLEDVLDSKNYLACKLTRNTFFCQYQLIHCV